MNRRIADIELLRGFAVLLVLFQHSDYNLIRQAGGSLRFLYDNIGGWTGVDLFFAISGFVIARDLIPRLILADSRRAILSTMFSFWIRRASRLWPSAWLWLLLILFATILFNQSGAFGALQTNLAASLAGIFNYGNFRFAAAFGRFDYGVSFPYWSLSLEEQFYLLLPLVVIIFRRRLSLLVLIFIVVAGVQIFTNRHVSLLLMVTRSDALLLGVLLAIWSRRESYAGFEPAFLSRHRWSGFFVLAILLSCLACIGSSHFIEFRFTVGIVAVISALLVFLASYDKNYLMPPNRLKQIFLWVGSRSYALYLIHIPAYFATREIWYRISPPDTAFNDAPNLVLAMTAIALVVIFSELNYRLIETPFRMRGKKLVEKIRRTQFQYQA
ncbi:acyltransferase family protein [Collimonas pratensis]|uniref:acyltransferase family protein n=1 Tax=Collimonas pratensis TaxID=279113 RepID=UPI00143D66CF|nr:acyltransferase [Collimonas pratensis]NKI70557.1 acyltransferase family protein [Collimonas pratensis]